MAIFSTRPMANKYGEMLNPPGEVGSPGLFFRGRGDGMLSAGSIQPKLPLPGLPGGPVQPKVPPPEVVRSLGPTEVVR